MASRGASDPDAWLYRHLRAMVVRFGGTMTPNERGPRSPLLLSLYND